MILFVLGFLSSSTFFQQQKWMFVSRNSLATLKDRRVNYSFSHITLLRPRVTLSSLNFHFKMRANMPCHLPEPRLFCLLSTPIVVRQSLSSILSRNEICDIECHTSGSWIPNRESFVLGTDWFKRIWLKRTFLGQKPFCFSIQSMKIWQAFPQEFHESFVLQTPSYRPWKSPL